MKIKDVLNFFNKTSEDERLVKGVTDDSKKIKEGFIFFALGKGNQYIKEAYLNGALLVISDEEKSEFYISNLKNLLLPFLLFYYHHPERKLRIFGVTGTNGKSTSAYLMHSMMKKSLLITSTKGIKNSFISKNTTPIPFEMIEALKLAKKKRLKYIIMEVSSIGIKEGRLKGLNFERLLLTNLESDHLDYHGSLKEYQNTKIEFLFTSDAFLYLPVKEYVRFKIFKELKHFELFSYEEVKIIQEGFNGTHFVYKNQMWKTRLFAEMNIKNILGVLTLLSSFISLNSLKRRLKKIKPLKGRMNIVNHSPLIIIDYAHTASSFLEALKNIKRVSKGRLIVVFGAGGNRDKSKRREYGRIVEEYGDMGIVTSDNPRDEDEEAIIDDIIEDSSFPFLRCPFRSRAIKLAFNYASEKDTIALIGKGEEQYQLIKGVKHRFSDLEEVKKCLKNI